MEIFLHIYFGLNLFFAGYYLADEYKWAESKLVIIILTVLTLFVGCIWLSLVLIYSGLTDGIKWISDFFQIKYWFYYYFTDRWKKVDDGKLEMMNRVAKGNFNTNSLRHRLYRKALNATNKLNNYTYIPNK